MFCFIQLLIWTELTPAQPQPNLQDTWEAGREGIQCGTGSSESWKHWGTPPWDKHASVASVAIEVGDETQCSPFHPPPFSGIVLPEDLFLLNGGKKMQLKIFLVPEKCLFYRENNDLTLISTLLKNSLLHPPSSRPHITDITFQMSIE